MKANILLFAERKDLEKIKKLWPQTEQTRVGKKAFFLGPYGFIEGRRTGVDG